jgi:hypothetical protein
VTNYLQTNVDKEVTQVHVEQLNQIIKNDTLLEQKFNDYVETWKPIMNTAPKTKNKAFRLPSFRFTFAAVILINPGGIIPMHAVIKPKNRVEISLLTSFG